MQLDLSGWWKVRLDRKKDGILKEYYRKIWKEEKEGLILPGILQAQGYGDRIGRDTPWVSSLHDNMWYLREEYQVGQEDGVSVPFLSQPPRHYLGWAWYQREVKIEEEGQYQLFLECTRWRTTVWIDGKEKGSIAMLCSPHSYLLGNLEKGKHTITVLVDNQMQYSYRPDGHAVSDALGATWNGITGEISLRKLPDVAVMENRIWWDISTKKVIVELSMQNLTAEKRSAEIRVIKKEVSQTEEEEQEFLPEERKVCKIELFYPKEEELWEEYQPNRKQIWIQCQCRETIQIIEEQFGFRKIEAREDGFFINGHPTYLRGTHFGGEFPLTGYPATNKEEWMRIFKICKEWGLNFMRFHSYCPTKAAFLAADEIGFYLQVECGMWNYFSKESFMQEVLYQETKQILASFGNHPSFVLFSPTNEPAGDWLEPLSDWLAYFRKIDTRRLYTIQSGWPYPTELDQITGTDYVYFHRSGYGPYLGGTIRNQAGWFGKDYGSSLEGIRYPVICHELGQWCAYPDFSVMEKFTGYIQPSNYKVFRAQAEKKGVLSQNKEFVYHSGRLQAAMYKEDLEANFRTPHIYGFELLDLHDYLGQGGAWVGVLDAFWEEKGYIKPEEFREFCNETVLLLRLEKYVFTSEEQLCAKAEIAHFGREKKTNTIVKWRLLKENQVLKEEPFYLTEILLGKNIPLGTISFSMNTLIAPAQYTIELILEEKEKKPLKNHWDFWLYPCAKAAADKIFQIQKNIFSDKEQKICILTDVNQAKKALQQGKTVLLSPPSSAFSYWCPPLNPKPVFWNSQMGPRFDRGLGILCDPSHPAFSEFPTKSYEQWQWAELLKGARGINLKSINPELKPIVQIIDDWNRSYKMALLLEAKVGVGKLLLSGCNLEKVQEDVPQRMQLKKSLLAYITSKEFEPKIELSEEEAFSWFQDTHLLQKLEAVCWIEELPKTDSMACISGNPIAGLELEQVKFPLHLHIRWKQPIWIEGLTYFPIQNRRDHRGDINEYEIWVRKEEGWIQKKSGNFATSFEPKEVFFDKVRTNEVILVIKSGFGCAFYQKWEITQEGWKLQSGSFSDHCVGIGEILIHSEEIYSKDRESNQKWIERGDILDGRTATLEIEE